MEIAVFYTVFQNGAQTWALKKVQENKLEATEMQIQAMIDVPGYKAGQDNK